MELDIVLSKSHILCPGESIKGNAIVRLAERVPLQKVVLQLRGHENVKCFWDTEKEDVLKENLSKEKNCHSQFSKELIEQHFDYRSTCILYQQLILWDIKNYIQQRESKRKADNNVVRRRSTIDKEVNKVQGALLLPFQFQLPTGLPPTIRADGGDICIEYDLCLRVELENDVPLKSNTTHTAPNNTTREKNYRLLIANDTTILYRNGVFNRPLQQKASFTPKTRKRWFSRQTSERLILKAGIPTVLYEETVTTLIPVTLAIFNNSQQKITNVTLKQVQRRRFKHEGDHHFETIVYGPTLYVNPDSNVLRRNKNILGPFQSILPLAVSLGPTIEGTTVQFTNFVHIQVLLEDGKNKIELELPLLVIRGKNSPFLQN